MASKPKSVDEYIASFSPDLQLILSTIRQTIADLVPDAQETISYGMPAFRKGDATVYYAAFRKHIGLYPPVKGNAALMKAVARYAGDKGNLKFPLDQAVPYALVARVAKAVLTKKPTR